MKAQISYNKSSHRRERSQKRSLALAILFAMIFLLSTMLACEKIDYGQKETRQFGDESAIVQEVRFSSNNFSIVGDIRYPEEGSLHPVIILVHGSGDATRYGAVYFEPLIEIFLRNGYAVLSWDKPGSGESAGEFKNGQTIFQRADILVDAAEVLQENPHVDASNIGLWGISQAGWVMPKALEQTDAFSFMIVVSGGGEDGIDQGAFQQGQLLQCGGGSHGDATIVEQYWSQMNKAETYQEYRNAVEILLEIPWITSNTPVELQEEKNWSPWPRDIDAFYDPMTTMRETMIPVLAFFGGKDCYVDPFQGADAYEAAFVAAGNSRGRVYFIEDANHVMIEAETGCPGEAVANQYMTAYLETLEFWLMEQ